MPRTGIEDQRHRRSAEHERDEGRRRRTSECPDRTTSVALLGRHGPSSPFPMAFPGAGPEIQEISSDSNPVV